MLYVLLQMYLLSLFATPSPPLSLLLCFLPSPVSPVFPWISVQMTEPPLLHRPHPRLHLQGDPPPVQDIDHDAALHQRRFEYRHYYRRVRALSAVYASEHLSLQNLSHLHTFNTLNILRMLQSCLNTNLQIFQSRQITSSHLLTFCAQPYMPGTKAS